ncbi:MAG: HAD family hydrolase [Desulfobacterales bacterium]
MKPDPARIQMRPIPTGMSQSGRLALPVKAVLFDVYGTLFISGSGDIGHLGATGGFSAGLESLCRRHQIDLGAEALLKRLKASIGREHERRKSAGTDFPEVDIEAIWREVLQWTETHRVRRFAVEFEAIVNPVSPMPGVASVLTAIHRGGMKLGLISNAQFYTPMLFEAFLGNTVEKLGFDRRLTVFSYEEKEAKPSTRLFQRCVDALETMGIEPLESVYVGNDMLNDIAPASRLGFQTVLFAGDRRSLRLRENHPLCRGLNPDAVVTELRGLVSLLDLTA